MIDIRHDLNSDIFYRADKTHSGFLFVTLRTSHRENNMNVITPSGEGCTGVATGPTSRVVDTAIPKNDRCTTVVVDPDHKKMTFFWLLKKGANFG